MEVLFPYFKVVYMIRHKFLSLIEKHFKIHKVCALLVPRQCGKTTLAKQVLESHPDSIYLDLEKAVDRKKLEDPAFYLGQNKDKLIYIGRLQPSYYSLNINIISLLYF